MIPRQVPIRVVFGAPLSFEKDAATVGISGSEENEGAAGGLRNVSDEELKTAHAAYVVALKKLFDDNKGRFGYADRELEIL